MACGIDFGTSNSTVSYVDRDGAVQMAALEGRQTTIPSAIFYDFEEEETVYGRAAVARFIDGHEGRLLRSLKSVLGSPLFDETTPLGRRRIAFEDILVGFLRCLKAKAETQSGRPLVRVVMGRPVHFVDHDANSDQRAEGQLARIAEKAGFSEVRFQYEPIAAALAYEQDLAAEELALIADIGGGTSDFTVIRLGPRSRQRADRSGDILATTGVRVGGTDLDRRLSLASVMPHLGLGTASIDPFTKQVKAELPRDIFIDLATWYKIHMLYTPKNERFVSEIRLMAAEPEIFDRYLRVIRQQTGHALAARVEDAKIALSDAAVAEIDLGELLAEADLSVRATAKTFKQSVASDVAKIRESVDDCLAAAGLDRREISSVFLTGGSTAAPVVREAICARMDGARIVAGEKFNSVGLGLGLDAGRQFETALRVKRAG